MNGRCSCSLLLSVYSSEKMSKISINLVVLNGDKYIEYCLNSILKQSFPHEQIQINILDNGSTDNTRLLIHDFKNKTSNDIFPKVNFIMSDINFGMWGGQEKLLKYSSDEYVVFLSVDVMLDKDFISRAIAILDADSHIGAVQAKIYQYTAGEPLTKQIIDTCGFEIYRNRRIGNIGHGSPDGEQFNQASEIFGVEGAVPIFRRQALESIRVMGEIADHDLFWYGEDLDVAWRLNLAGWKQIYEPSIIAWHDRGTTKSHTHGSWLKYISHVHIRQQLSIKKRRLEWRNARWTRIKNDYIINILKDLPYILWRETEVLGYTILFEPIVLKEIPKFLRFLPKMLRKRRAIMVRAVTTPQSIHKFFK